MDLMGGSRGKVRDPDPPGKSQVAIGYLRNSVTDPLEKQLDHWVQILLEGGPYSPL